MGNELVTLKSQFATLEPSETAQETQEIVTRIQKVQTLLGHKARSVEKFNNLPHKLT
jgi:hypothetical protein